MIESATNYTQIIKTITAYDNIISSHAIWGDFKIPEFSSIMDDLLNNDNKDRFCPLIYQTFKLFLDKKSEIIINMDTLNRFITDTSILNVIFGGTGFKVIEYTDNSNDYSTPDDDTNIPRFDIFENLEVITIDGVQTNNYGTRYFPLSLNSLLLLLDQHSGIKEIKIGGGRANDGTSWLSSVWERNKSVLQSDYENKGYVIEYDYRCILIKSG